MQFTLISISNFSQVLQKKSYYENRQLWSERLQNKDKQKEQFILRTAGYSQVISGLYSY